MIKKIRKWDEVLHDRLRKIVLHFYLNICVKRKKIKVVKCSAISSQYKQNIKEYWKRWNININSNYHRWYSFCNGVEDVKYIPEDIFYGYILPFYNRTELAKAYSDKTVFIKLLAGMKQPLTLVRNQSGINYDRNNKFMNEDEVLQACKPYSKLIFKPSIDSGLANGIIVISNDIKKHAKEILETKRDFVMQEFISQHEVLESLHPGSINTVRIMTFLQGESITLSGHIRIGVKDNEIDQKGITCGINEQGILNERAYDSIGHVYFQHPQGYKFAGKILPSYDKLKKIAEEAHCALGHFKLISWDFAIDQNSEPVLIEMNLRALGINSHQLATGPLFGRLTESVLEEVFK